MILAITSLFIFVLAALALSSLETGVIESKLASNFTQKSIAFQAAESELHMKESEIYGHHLILPLSKAVISYQKKLLSIDSCHKKRYQIEIVARYQNIKVRLLAIDDYLARAHSSACKSEVGFKRIYWNTTH